MYAEQTSCRRFALIDAKYGSDEVARMLSHDPDSVVSMTAAIKELDREVIDLVIGNGIAARNDNQDFVNAANLIAMDPDQCQEIPLRNYLLKRDFFNGFRVMMT